MRTVLAFFGGILIGIIVAVVAIVVYAEGDENDNTDHRSRHSDL